eukprot:scaffold13904_cov57-Skeletonema_menzelii.AAC.1
MLSNTPSTAWFRMNALQLLVYRRPHSIFSRSEEPRAKIKLIASVGVRSVGKEPSFLPLLFASSPNHKQRSKGQ